MAQHRNWLVVMIVIALFAAPSLGAVTFTKIVDTNDLVPGTTVNFEGLALFDTPAIDAGNIAFRGQSTNTNLTPRDGIYTNLGGPLTAVAETGTLIPDGLGDVFASDNTVFGFSSPSISGSNIVFEGDSPGAADRGVYGVFGFGLNPLETIQDTRNPANGGFTTLASPAINGDDAAYWGFSVFTFPIVTSFEGIYHHAGGSGGSSTTIADKGDTVLGKFPIRTMQNFNTAQIDIAPNTSDPNASDVVFIARDSFNQYGLYRTFGSIGGLTGAPRVYSDKAIPGGIGNFDLFFTSSVSADDSLVAFEGQNTAGSSRGVYVVDGFSVSAAADLNTAVPGPADSFVSFSDVSIEGATGALVFQATDNTGSQGLYTINNNHIGHLVEVGDTLDSKTVSGLAFGHEGLDGTTAVFAATFTDGSEGLFTTDITTADLLIPILQTGPSAGSVLGGSTQIGGLDYDLADVTAGGTLEVTMDLLPPGDPLLAGFPFQLGSDPVQVWDIDFAGAFNGVATLTFGYDDNFLDPNINEADLGIQHQLPNGNWEDLNVIAIDTLNNTLTVETTSFSPFALGSDSGPVIPAPTALFAGLPLLTAGLIRRRRR